MARPWSVVERVSSADGELELRHRAPADWLITVAGRVLMNSAASRSEEALGRIAAQAVADRAAPRLLLAGLGMGCTLRAALDRLPAAARVRVVELHAAVAQWCRGPLAEVSASALEDPRVTLEVGDVAATIAEAEGRGVDAIVLDLFEGPLRGPRARRDPWFGDEALERAREALAPGGWLAVWSEDRDTSFERRLSRLGYGVRVERPGRGGLRHAVTLAQRAKG